MRAYTSVSTGVHLSFLRLPPSSSLEPTPSPSSDRYRMKSSAHTRNNRNPFFAALPVYSLPAKRAAPTVVHCVNY